ncbi:MAG: hypothetical protein SPK46_01865 [Candidatus Onthovivens sp.]
MKFGTILVPISLLSVFSIKFFLRVFTFNSSVRFCCELTAVAAFCYCSNTCSL